jgi:hypothetical protein
MTPIKRTLALTAGVIITSVGLTVLWIVNRGIYLIGLSTVTADAKSAPAGLIDLLVLIASADPWILGTLAVAAIGLQFWMTYQVVRTTDAAKILHEDLKHLPMRMTSLESSFREFTSKFDDVVRFASNTAKAAIQRQRETADIEPELARLFDIQQSLRLAGNAPEIGWDEWHRQSREFIEAFAALRPLIHENLLTMMEQRSIFSPMGGKSPMRHGQTMASFGPQWGQAYSEFEDRAMELIAVKANIERKMELATVPELLIKP